VVYEKDYSNATELVPIALGLLGQHQLSNRVVLRQNI